jgi:hypothetical protein
MKVLIGNRIRETWPNYIYLLPPYRRRYTPGRWWDAKGSSAMLAKIIRYYNLETGNRASASYLGEAINIRHERIERAPAFRYRGKARRLFIRNARIRYPHSLACSCHLPPQFDHDL